MKSEKYIRSPFFYVGDKYKLLPQLETQFPRTINRFIEPFCGGGSVFLNTKANEYLLNDIDSNVISLHKFLVKCSGDQTSFWSDIEKVITKYGLSATYMGKEAPAELRIRYPKTYFAHYNRDGFKKLRDDYNADKSNLLLLYVLLIYGFNRMLRFNSQGDYNLPVGNVDFNDNVTEALNGYFDYVSDKNLTFYNVDFEAFLNSLEYSSDDFVYLDPPYLITFSEYNKLWNVDSEKRMLEALDRLNDKGIRFAVSNVVSHKGKTNGVFIDWASNYSIVDVQSNYISYHDNTRKNSWEVLVKNY